MKRNVEKLCQLFREHVTIPVFDYSLPDDFTFTCLVVREDSYNLELGEGEYHLNIYVPNTEKKNDPTRAAFVINRAGFELQRLSSLQKIIPICLSSLS